MLSIPMEPQEVMGPKEANKNDTHMTSAAAFVEGGIQDACDDACSICLENFSDSDPSTVTNCKHEFHLQCILEWCQRSSQCPMCWQPISLKDPTSQELFEAVEQERNFRSNGSRNTTLFHHPMLGEFEIQHLPSGSSEADLEERILQHLAAAAAMRRAHHHVSRREGHRGRPSSQGHPRFLAFSGPRGVVSSSSAHVDHEREQSSGPRGSTSVSFTNSSDDPELLVSTHPAEATFHASGSANRSSACRTTSENQDREGASELQSFSESLRARLNSLSMRYKESFSRSTRGWKERLFARNNSMADIGSEVRREVNAGIANVSRLMEQSRDQNRAASHDSLSNSAVEPLNIQQQGNQTTMERSGEGRRTSVSHGAASSISD